MLSDYHLHTDFSGDCIVPAKEQIQQAVRLGMKSICITDHHDYDVISDIDFTLNLNQYFSALKQLQIDFRDQIDLHIGIELGLQPHLKSYFEEFLSLYDFDFIIGSTHFIEKKDPAYPEFFENKKEQDVYRMYFQTTLDNLASIDEYDVAGHIDYIIRYGPNKSKFYSYSVYQDIFDSILKTLIEKGKGIECNTGGYRKGLQMPNPSPEIIRRYRELGGEIITIGSDAHVACDLGSNFKQASSLLKECGFSYYTTFHQRKPQFHKL